MATDPNLLMALVNGPTLAGNAVYSGFDQGLQRRGAQQQLAIQQFQLGQAQQAAQQQQQYQTDVAGFTADPTPQNLMNLIAKYPKQYEALQAGWKLKDQAQRTADLGLFSDIHAALSKGKVDLAAETLARRIAAEKAAGIDTSQEEQWLDRLKGGDPNAASEARAWALGQIAAATGPDRFSEAYKTVGGEGGGFTLGPGARRFDAGGKLIAEAPFAPRPVTVGEGETVVEYAPGTGDGSQIDRMIAITPFAESGNREFNADGSRVTSPKGARGVMQVMPKTATDPGYGIAPSNGSPEDDARLGRQYLAKMLDVYGNPAQAWAAYNAGPGAVDKAIRDGGAQWLSKLPAETRAYVAKNMSALNGGQSGGSRVIAQGAPKQGYQILTPQEIAAIPGLDPSKAYQRAPDGQITAIGGAANNAQLKPWPVQALQARTENNASIANIDNALKLLDPKNNSSAAKTARDSVGFGTGGFGLWDPNRTDPAGADFRALIGQIGGIIIKDISGAAVSASEDDRLKKWIPYATDSAQTIRAKLTNLKREISQRNSVMDQTYNEDQGYRPFSRGEGSAPQQASGRPQFKIVARRPAR